MDPLLTTDELPDLLAAPQVLVFKHSTSCPVSGWAYREVRQFAEEHPELPVYVVDVHAQRALSNRLADTLDVRHESPQALLVRDGTVVWHASHFRVTQRAIEGVLE